MQGLIIVDLDLELGIGIHLSPNLIFTLIGWLFDVQQQRVKIVTSPQHQSHIGAEAAFLSLSAFMLTPHVFSSISLKGPPP